MWRDIRFAIEAALAALMGAALVNDIWEHHVSLAVLSAVSAVPLDRAPTIALRAFVAGSFAQVETGPSDNPIVAQAIAIKLLKERTQ